MPQMSNLSWFNSFFKILIMIFFSVIVSSVFYFSSFNNKKFVYKFKYMMI